MSYDPVNKIWKGPVRPSIFNTSLSIGSIALNIFKQNPDRVVQICDDTGVETSCKEMFIRTAKICNFISEKTDLKQGDVVGILATNSENLSPVVFACFTLGLPISPLATIFSETEIVEMYSKTKPRAIFCDFDLVEKVLSSLAKIPLPNCKVFTLIRKVDGISFVDEILAERSGNFEDFEPPILPNISSTPLVILCSSGTSGSSKGITRSHEHWITFLNKNIPAPLGEDSVSFLPSQLHWLSGIHGILSGAFFQTKRLYTTKNVGYESLKEILRRRKVTMLLTPPYMLEMFVKMNKGEIFEYVKQLFIGGASVTGVQYEKVRKIFPNAQFFMGYGSSEGDLITMSTKVKDGSSGKIAPNVEIKIIDESGNRLGPNETGQICYRATVMFSGYYNDPEATKLTYDPENWCYTGDVGYFDDDEEIFVVDRIKHMLKYNGWIIPPIDVEKVINEIEGVISSCVVGVFDEGNDIIVAFVIKDPKRSELSEKFIENYVNGKVIDVKKIRGGVHFLKEFPTTTTGKIKNRELKEVAEKIYRYGKN